MQSQFEGLIYYRAGRNCLLGSVRQSLALVALTRDLVFSRVVHSAVRPLANRYEKHGRGAGCLPAPFPSGGGRTLHLRLFSPMVTEIASVRICAQSPDLRVTGKE